MGWFTSSPSRDSSSSPSPPSYVESISAQTTATPSLTTTTPASGSDVTACPPKPKPCCVCKEEKAARDECMLYSRADDPQEDCKGMVMKYRECMAGFGFKI